MKEFVPKDESATAELSCSVCLRLLHHPKEVVECGHMFCAECIVASPQGTTSRVEKCPMCRCTKMALKTPNRAILRLLEMTQGYCGQCGWQGNYEQYMVSHEKPACVNDPEAVRRAAAATGGHTPMNGSTSGGVSPSNAAVTCSASPAVPIRESASTGTLPFSPSAAFPTVAGGALAPSSSTVYGNGVGVASTTQPPLTTYGNGVGLAPAPSAAAYPPPMSHQPTVAGYPPPAGYPTHQQQQPPRQYPQCPQAAPPSPQQPQQGGYQVPGGGVNIRPMFGGAATPPPSGYPTANGYAPPQQQQQQRPPQAGGGYGGYPQPQMMGSAVYPPMGLQPTPSGVYVDTRGRANTLPVGTSAGGFTSATGASNVYFNPFGGGMMSNPHPTQ